MAHSSTPFGRFALQITCRAMDDSAALAFLDKVKHHGSILETGKTSFRFAQSKKSRNQ